MDLIWKLLVSQLQEGKRCGNERKRLKTVLLIGSSLESVWVQILLGSVISGPLCVF